MEILHRLNPSIHQLSILSMLTFILAFSSRTHPGDGDGEQFHAQIAMPTVLVVTVLGSEERL